MKRVKECFIIKWKNKYSGEEGYVKAFKRSDGHFINTYDWTKAKRYMTKRNIDACVNDLVQAGEADLNDLEVIKISE